MMILQARQLLSSVGEQSVEKEGRLKQDKTLSASRDLSLSYLALAKHLASRLVFMPRIHKTITTCLPESQP